jgi:cytochrome c2
VAIAACGGGSGSPNPRQVAGGDASRGKQLIHDVGCGSCHNIPGVSQANGNVGPPLTGFSRRGFVAGVLANTPESLIRWLQDPQSVVPGNDMPNMGLNENDARDIATYLYTLK